VAVPLRSIGVLSERFSREFSFTRVVSDVIMTWPSARSFEWGATYLSLVFMPIPRAFWPGKPLGGVGALVNQVINPGGSAAALGYYGFGYSPSMVGEAYLNFGWVGILLVFILFGLLARSAYAYVNLHRQNPSAVLLYAVCLWSIFMELRGGFTNATTMWLINMVSITVALRFVTYRVSTSRRT
jgi:oligosaccharide repeat unit polymerase